MMAKLSLGLQVVVSLTICICRGGDANTALEDRNRASEITASQLANFALDEQTVFEFPIIDRDGNIEYVDISKEISTYRSEEFGRQLLGMEMYDDIDRIRKENPQSANERIIKLWFEGGTENPVTCRFLANVLYKTGLIDRANDIKTTCERFYNLDEPYQPRTLKRYYKELSEMYDREPVIEATLFLPKKLRERRIIYVDLEMEEKGVNVSLSELLYSVQSGMRVLFLGRPGVGKTTVTRYMTKILLNDRRFYLVVKLHLRGLLKRINNLVELLKVCGDESFQSDSIQRISKYIETKSGEGVIFLLDGYDDYHEPSNYIHNLLKKNYLKKAIVILTSRPTAVENIKDDFDRQIEIIGFGSASVQTYLEQMKLPEAKYRIINHYLSTHPNVRQLCYLPLHLSMLVYVTILTENDDALSVVDTETDLYLNFLTLTIRQYEEQYLEKATSLVNCLENVDSETNLCIIFRKICQLSFKGLMPDTRKSALVSTSFNELPANLNISDKLEKLSLFKVVPIDDKRGIRLYKYYYSHPTFQELFAALHLTTLPRNERLSYVQHRSMNEVYKFFLGTIGNKNAKNYDSEYLSRTFVSFTMESVYRDNELYIIECAHETGQNFVPLLKAVGVITESNSLNVNSFVYERYCWYFGHVLLSSPLYKFNIVATLSEKIASCISVIEDYFKLYEHEILDIVDVKHLAVGTKMSWMLPFTVEKDVSVMTVMPVMNFLSVFQKCLKHLELSFMTFRNNKSVLLLADTLKSFDNLTSLALLVHVDVLEMALKNLPSLNHLKLGIVYNGLNDIPSNLFQFRNMRNIKSLTLALIGDIRGSVNMTSLFGELRYLTNLQSLSIICRICIFHNATEMLQRIKRVSVPELALDLDLNPRYGGMVSVISKMTNLRNLSLYIDFDFHGIRGNTGVKELGEGLKSLVDLQVLLLSLNWKLLTNESINEGVEAIVNALKQLNGLKVLELTLRHNGSTNGIASLFPSLPHLQELQLKLIDNKTNITMLLNGIKQLKHLKKLDLSGIDITDEDVPSLLDALKYLNLSILDLSHNKIGDTGLELLGKTIETGYLSSLQVLRLQNNKFSDTSADIFSQKVVKLSELRTFVLRNHGRYNVRAKTQIYQQRAIRRSELKQHKESNASSSLADVEPWIGACIFGGILFVMGFVAALRYPGTATHVPQHVISSNALAALTASTSSASFLWKLRRSPGNDLDGTGTNIAILDSAVACQYVTLLGKQITSIDCFLPKLSNRFDEHGTLCASIAIGSAAQIDETTSIHEGVAPGAACFAYRVTEGNRCFSEAVLRALDDIEMKIRDRNIQIDVVSISLDITDNQDEIEQKILSLTERKVVFVAAAGNLGEYAVESCFPARLKSVISVGARDRYGRESKFNSCGHIDVYAIGEDIPLAVTTETTEKTQTKAKTATTARAGTSFATPAIAGLVLLLKQLANRIGPPACDHIHNVEILRKIFDEDMRVTSGSGKVLHAPGVFLERVTSRPEELNEIVRRHLRTLREGDMEIG